MQRAMIGSIPVFYEPGPAPLSGALIFRVGLRDESFRTSGVTHVIEHLVMGTLPKSHLDHNARVEAGLTIFHATGRPEAVADFLNRVSAALADLPIDRLAHEVGVIEAEDGNSVHPALAWAAGLRYGNDGIGLVSGAGAPLDQLTVEHVRAHAARFFVDGNTALIFTGNPPEGLELALPLGPRPQREAFIPTNLPARGFAIDEMPWPVLSYTLPDHEMPWLHSAVLTERVMDDLRYRQGISYSVDGDYTYVDGEVLVALMPDGRPGQEKAVTESLWRALVDLAATGPSQTELDHVIEAAAEDMRDPRAALDRLTDVAARHPQRRPDRQC